MLSCSADFFGQINRLKTALNVIGTPRVDILITNFTITYNFIYSYCHNLWFLH